MSSSGTIDAKEAIFEEPLESEVVPITLHIGIFFDSCDQESQLSSWLSSNYTPEENEFHRKSTITIPFGVCPDIDEMSVEGVAYTNGNGNTFLVDGMEHFGHRIAEVLDYAFRELNNILNGYWDIASEMTIEIDTFCVEDGFFSASMFCEAIEPGRFDKLPPYGEFAISDWVGGGMLEDFRMRGTNVLLNSITTFQVVPDPTVLEGKVEHSGTTASNKHGSPYKSGISGSKNKKGGRIKFDYESAYYGDDDSNKLNNYDFIRQIDFESPLFDIKVISCKYPGRYSNLCDFENLIGNIGFACDILALTCYSTIYGAPVGAILNSVSVCLSSIDVLLCFSLSAMALVDGDMDTAKYHAKDAGIAFVGALPLVGKIIGKSSKAVKFATKIDHIPAERITKQTLPANKPIPLHPSSGPHLTVVPDVAEKASATAKSVAKVTATERNFHVIEKVETRRIKVANGQDIVEYGYKLNGSDIVMNSVDGFGSYNSLFKLGSSSGVSNPISTGTRSSINSTKKMNSIFESYKVEPTAEIYQLDNNIDKLSGDQRRGYAIINFLNQLYEISKQRYVGYLRWLKNNNK